MFQQTIDLNTSSKKEIQDITNEITNVIKESGHSGGLVNILTLHTTACITINENDPDLWEDFLHKFEDLITPNYTYKHQPNADAHIISSIIKSSVTIPFKGGKTDLGTYQRILLIELDGPRQRKINVTIVSSG